MGYRTVGFSLFIMLFTWVGIAEAASISTRVRILESKVSKIDRAASTENTQRQAFEARIDEKLITVDDLKRQMDKMQKQNVEHKKQDGLEDKRYAFP